MIVKQNTGWKKYIIWFSSLFLIGILGTFLFFVLIARGQLGFMPAFKELENPPNILASEIYSEDVKILDKYFLHENRTFVHFDNLPPHLIDALISIEDARFFSHSGIDLRGLARVFKGILTGDTRSGGGSTISQQLAKMLFPREDLSGTAELVLRKFREWVIAVKLERSYTKDEILLMYLNKYDFLNLAVGIKSAAGVYFSIPPDSLQLHQSAMLVGMAQNSSLFNPVRRPELVLQRRNVVLNQMAKYGYITRAVRDSVKQLPLDLDFQKVDYRSGPAPYFREYLRLTLTAQKPDKKNYPWNMQRFREDSVEWETNPLYGWCNKNRKPDGQNYNLYADGLRIFTTIDSRMQQYAVESMEYHLKNNLQPDFDGGMRFLRNPPFSNNLTASQADSLLNLEIRRSDRYRSLNRQGKSFREIRDNFNQPVEMTIFSWKGERDTIMTPADSIKWYLRHFRSSFMAMEPHSGKVKAYVGGINYKYFMYDMVKTGKRQVGSTVKPFLYTLAMQNELTPCTKVPYVSQQFQMWDGSIWEPKDAEFDAENEGKLVTLKWGLAQSRNRISAWVMKQFTPQAMAAVMRRMGIYSPIDPVPSMFLGTADITLYEMVGAFNTYANQGVYVKPYFVTRIEDRYGNVIANFQPERQEAFDEQTAYLMVNLLQGVIDSGTGIRLRVRDGYGKFTMPIAGKTGTTQNQSDGWFIGITPRLTAGVWTGADLRSIHFRSLASGQGANMALPIWGYFYKKVLADPTLGYNEDMRFKSPDNFTINLNCDEDGDQNVPSDFEDFF